MKGLLGCLLAASLVGCATPTEGSGPYQEAEEQERDTQLAEELTREAAELMKSDVERAESLLKEALTADIFHGPAHNNLGVVFLKQGKLYEAAHELEWARKLLPGHPDPRVNLGIVMEGAGRAEEALAAYEAALEVYPDYLPAVMGAARLELRHGIQKEPIEDWLDDIAMRSEDPSWREWATAEIAKGP